MRLPLLVAPLLCGLPSLALAGGLGVMATGGVHTAKSYYYDFDNKQGIDLQVRPNAGVGLEAMLGDRDERIQGVLRMYMLADGPVTTPDTGDLSLDEVVYPPVEDLTWEPKGVALVGIQWGLYGDPEKLELTLTSLVGTAFVTRDLTEFLYIDVGPGVTYKLSDNLQVFGEGAVSARYRKGLSVGGNVYTGVRVLFD